MRIKSTGLLYHYNSPIQWHTVTFTIPDLALLGEIRRWCTDTYGPCISTHAFVVDKDCERWHDNCGFGKVMFAHEDDMNWFILRWS